MQGARHSFINGKQDVKAAEKHSVECIVLLTLWFIILSCLGRCNKRPSHNILFNRSIVHAIRMHVSEVRSPGVVSAHTIVCVYVLCTHYVCVPCPSADSAACVQARNRRCSKIKQTNILLICASVATPVYKFNIDELLLKLLAKRGSLTFFMYLPVQAARACQRRVCMCSRCSHRTEHSRHVLKGVVFRAQMLFNRLHF